MRLIAELVIGHALGYICYIMFEAPVRSVIKRATGYEKARVAEDVNDNVKKVN